MAKHRNKIIDLLQYLALRLFAMFVHMFPVRMNYHTARLMGDIIYFFDRRHRHRAAEHLRRSFPEWDEKKIQRVARESMREMTYLGIEVLFTPRLITPYRWQRHVRLANMEETLRLLIERPSGVIFITGHFGNWEVVGYTMATLGFPTVSVARPLDNEYVNEYIMGVRERTGQSILYKKGASRSVDELLEDRGALSFIADQDAGRKGVFVDFFHRPASTYKSIGLLAMRHRAPIIVGYGRRLGEDYRFEIGIEGIIYPEQWDDKDDPLKWITQQYTSSLENIIRRSPGQYLWVHRRWKHRPDGTRAMPDGIA